MGKQTLTVLAVIVMIVILVALVVGALILAGKAVDNYPWTFGIVVGIIVCSCIGIKWYYDSKETLEDAEKAEVPTKQIEN